MKRQLTLLEVPADWRFDEETKRIGLEGIARARAVLRHSQRQSEHELRGETDRLADGTDNDHAPRAA